MVKQSTSTPGVFLVGPEGKTLRPWCSKCHKFLKSETATHDCTPSSIRGGHRSSVPGQRRRIRLTPKTRANLKVIFTQAAIGAPLGEAFFKIAKVISDSKSGDKTIKKLKKMVKKSASKADNQKKLDSLIRKYL